MKRFCVQAGVWASFIQGSRAARSTLVRGQISVDAANEPFHQPCQVGQGQAWFDARIDISEDAAPVSIEDCIALCERRPACVSIDFTTNSQSDACRLYRPNTPRLGEGGPDERQYCIVRISNSSASTTDNAYQLLRSPLAWLNEAINFGFSGTNATTSTTTSLDPHELREALGSWVNSHGEKEVNCDISEKEHGRMRVFLSSSLFDVNATVQNDSVLVDAFMSLKPKGRAIWIGDAAKGARPFWVRFTSFGGTKKTMQKKTNITLEWTFIDSGLWGNREKSIEGMEKFLDGVGVVYLAGGDHMHLMYTMRTTLFGEVLRRRVLEGSILLVARSAGTIDTGRDVGFSTELQSIAKLDGDLSGLGLIGDCSVRPHFDHQPAWHDKKGQVSHLFQQFLVEQYRRTNGTGKLVTLNDGDALMVQNGKAVIVSA
eukprot:TRINITY_DN29050_c0_g1_i1.p1 TRINITY_DN29050_c0_g1~~TRINITY_DN29050_c0_g1_i1.p1  ORF type:complete len:429 (-),score=72.73 TRINITY_DN29050_c0_g1_i1:38-1324(-)